MCRRTAICLILILVQATQGLAQAPALSLSGPSQALINQDVCVSMTLSNTGATGFQPYLRVFIPTGITTQDISEVVFMGESLPSPPFMGTTQDPQEPDNWVSPNYTDQYWVEAPIGYWWFNIALPFGSMVPDDVNLSASFCTGLSSNAALNEPFQICVQPVFLYGNDPSGESAPIEGEMTCLEITPIPYRMSASANETVVPTGSCWPLEQKLSVDIAFQESLEELVGVVEIPEAFVYEGIIDQTPGCSVVQEPSFGSNGGTVQVECANLVGSAEGDDMFVVMQMHVADSLDLFLCDSLDIFTPFEVSSGVQAPLTRETKVTARHLKLILSGASLNLVPGTPADIPVEYFVSEFVEGITDWSMTLNLPDGITLLGNATADGVPLTTVATPGPENSTDLTIGITEEIGDLLPCGNGLISIPVFLEETLGDGTVILARDAFPIAVSGTYSVLNGAEECQAGIGATVSVAGVNAEFAITSSPPNGEIYTPGSEVVYDMVMEIPSEDAKDIRFELLLPTPVQHPSLIDPLTDIQFTPLDNWGVMPVVSMDLGRNALIMDFGSVSRETTGAPIVIAVEVHALVGDAPFASGLEHSVVANFFSSNSACEAAGVQFLERFEVGTPELEMFFGPTSSDNPVAEITDLGTWATGDISGIDGQDEIEYRISIRNISPAPAYDVIAFFGIPFNRLAGCDLESVTHPGGAPAAYSGELFESGLLLEEIPGDDPTSTLDVVHIDLVCYTRPANVFRCGEQFSVHTEMDWASSPNASVRFDPIIDTSYINVSAPITTRSLLGSSPGLHVPGIANIGEVQHYEYDIRTPEARCVSVSFRDTLQAGLAFESLDSIRVSDGVFSIATNVNDLPDAVQFNDLGTGPEDARREMFLNFGDITNNNSDNSTSDHVRLYYSTRVINAAAAVNSASLTGMATTAYTDFSTSEVVQLSTIDTVQVREPLLLADAAFTQPIAAPGESTYIIVTIGQESFSEAPAYGITFDLDLPIGMIHIPGNFLSECPELLVGEPEVSFGSVAWTISELPEGQTCQFQIGVALDEAYPMCTSADACLTATWRSLSEASAASLGTSPHALGYPRTGSTLDPGGALNTYRREACASIQVGQGQAQAPVVQGEQEACFGQDLTLSVQPFAGNDVVYNWNGPDGPLPGNGYSITISDIAEADAGEYSVSVEIGGCVTLQSDSLEISILPQPEVSVDAVLATCLEPGDTLELVPEIVGEGAYEYLWTGPNFVSTDSIAVILNATATQTGVYELQITDAFGCGSGNALFTVTITDSPPTPGISGDVAVCLGQDLWLQSTEYAAAAVYHWNTPSGEIITTTNELLLPGFLESDGGLYSVWAEVSACPTDTSATLNISPVATPSAPELSVSVEAVCENGTVAFATATIADEYQWSGPNDYLSQSPDPPSIQNLTMDNQGTYNLQVWQDGCPSEISSVYLTVLPGPATPALISNGPICEGETLVLNSPDNAEMYSWEFPGSDPLVTTDPYLELAADPELAQGGFALQVFDGTCWSAPSDFVFGLVEAIPVVEANAGSNRLGCPEGNLMLVDGNPLYDGFWTLPDELFIVGDPSTDTTVITGMEAGETYWAQWSIFTEVCGVFSTDSIEIHTLHPPNALLDEWTVYPGIENPIQPLDNDLWGGDGVTLGILQEPLLGEVEIDGNAVVYESEPERTGSDSFVYQICLNECPSLCDTAIIHVDFEPLVVIPDVITPNGDQSNEYFEIAGIQNIPENKLVIFNRWGKEVFRAAPYSNDWNGTHNGEPLPEGTYFYTLEDPSVQGFMHKGFVIIKR